MDRSDEEDHEFTDALSQQSIEPREKEATIDTRESIKTLPQQLPGDENEEINKSDKLNGALTQQFPAEEEDDNNDNDELTEGLPPQLV